MSVQPLAVLSGHTHETCCQCGTFSGPVDVLGGDSNPHCGLSRGLFDVLMKEIENPMSKKPLADDRRRELATEAFAKIVRAAFKGETDKANEALAVIETQFGEE